MRAATPQDNENQVIAGFQSTPLLRAATSHDDRDIIQAIVSIHAALASGDSRARKITAITLCFNPRRSCERRHTTIWSATAAGLFQSTPLLRAATQPGHRLRKGKAVSIHAALASGDKGIGSSELSTLSFNPRRSCERRRLGAIKLLLCKQFQSTPLLRAATIFCCV